MEDATPTMTATDVLASAAQPRAAVTFLDLAYVTYLYPPDVWWVGGASR